MKIRHPVCTLAPLQNWPRTNWRNALLLLLINVAWLATWLSARGQIDALESELAWRCTVLPEEGIASCGMIVDGHLHCTAVRGAVHFIRQKLGVQ